MFTPVAWEMRLRAQASRPSPMLVQSTRVRPAAFLNSDNSRTASFSSSRMLL